MKLGVIGCGKMGTALVAGAVRAGALGADQVIGFDPHPAARDAFATATGSLAAASLKDLAGCDTLLLCTKPQQAAAALSALRESATTEGLLISVAAGLTLEWLGQHAPSGWRHIRCMPNTPALVGEGAAGFACSKNATEADRQTAHDLLGAVGSAHSLAEPLLDAVTGLSGSGPAFVFLMIEALADGGVRSGLPRDIALELAARTLRGAATMVLETGLHPGQLKDQVTSPAGTTIAGIAELEARGLRSALIEAVTAATRRSQELGRS
ncbi:pyrroline-5-carboxylate reductase [Haloferula luteola]|uniref:Pyrroline-5-carboxylate reductase n=1 Tax=Haloferula luteola TaxID=595692 RepID=A0A840V766_9BACT|nr:pyrroline-5-carboxylate reductase [Haloferula luteola]MBB5350588.1 pyrroline-5-carboxylate reductase [Haloferula luteola]